MKGFTAAVIAMCAAGASARTVTLAAVADFHTDGWCAEHHLGEGPATCIQHSGCCYDGRIGVCHSCDAHTDEWCGTYGGDDVKTCSGYSGCTMDYDAEQRGTCISNSDPDSITDEVTCEEALTKALNLDGGGDGDLEYVPQCTDDGLWEAEQYDEQSDFRWCVDGNGHEIPDTRRKDHAFQKDHINCSKERLTNDGMQCPNAVTLSTGNGEVLINDHDDVGNCDVTCNTDPDCRGHEWCCYNGCGYSCQIPIKPKADCKHLNIDDSLSATDLSREHGTRVTISCAHGYSGAAAVEVECKHGSWNEYSIQCYKSCEEYSVPPPARQRDYNVVTYKDSTSHGSAVRLECAKGYGSVAGSPDAMRFYREKIECINGAWEETTLQCSSCFDAPADGPHAWWTGKVDGGERGDGFDCQYFSSRPQKCAEFPEARNACRISCRTCEQALMKYKVKAVREEIAEVKHPDKWIKAHIRDMHPFQNLVTETRRVKVPKRQRKDHGEPKL